ncbi:MAG: ATP-dependent helicase [Aromatoleum sp.]|jgi:DNA helicase-2/ATP-dependent DNA helicase PcrA|uniref:ATP-dependent helicase n=1 Tax=Aromatoleum sp. TaxID=2307007 RepID=UPI002894EF54|nr:ATP-dependent helicase [Aromatoleum sp.]MDT3672715.1 ATP-dependent helicase [Aromatoleum sp.]
MKAAGKPVMESLQSDDSGPGAPLVAEAPASGTPGSRDPGAWLERLNDAQRDAVLFGTGDAPADGPLLVIAGAGSGKTNTLAHRVAHLVASGADPHAILLLTFSRRAADEMGRRVSRLLAQLAKSQKTLAGASLEWSGTFHSVGARLLREFAPAIGLDAAFTIHDREDSGDLMNLVRHELGLSAKSKRFPMKGTCLAIYSAKVNTQAPLEDVLKSSFPWCAEWQDDLKRLFRGYVEAKQAQQVLDYDDLLLYWGQMMAEPALAAELGTRFRHVLVDEYQDTNRLQAAILLAMKPDGRGLTVVGDDAQSIYAFRGATVRNILDFPAQFDPPAQRITLDRNYRSTRTILDAANGVIALAAERFTKDLWTERASDRKPRLVAVKDDAGQADYVVGEVLARREDGVKLKQQAVLFRAAHHSARLEIELTRRNIPFVKFGGLKFLEAAHVKDVLAVARWAQNPRDRVSGFRAVQLLAGVGPKIAGRVLDNVAAAPPGCALLAEQPVPDTVRTEWTEFAALVEAAGRNGSPWPASFELTCRWYEGQIERLYDDAAVRAGDIEQLARIAATYPSLERFLTELTLDPPNATSDEAGVPLLDEDYLILSTIHSAKGQEWSSVTLLNVVDGCMPSDLATGSSAEIEEERRLLYVAMTRAKDHLDLVVPQRFHVSQQPGGGDRHVYANRTRFIPNRLLPHFEQVSWPPPAVAPRPAEESRKIALDLAAKMRAMWD